MNDAISKGRAWCEAPGEGYRTKLCIEWYPSPAASRQELQTSNFVNVESEFAFQIQTIPAGCLRSLLDLQKISSPAASTQYVR
jgi:hypothetical protein